MQWLNYHHLYYFRTIAKTGGIAKAAEVLRLGQPTLSTQLKQLEDAIGHALFERRNRTLVLTEAGKVALEYANEIFERGDEFLEVMKDQTFTKKVDLKIGAMDSIPKHLILSLCNDAIKTGNCSISLLEGDGDSLFRELLSHQIDLILANNPVPVGTKQGVFSRSLARVPISIFASQELKHLRAKFPQSLDGQNAVLPTAHSKLRHDINHFCHLEGIKLNVIAETQDTSLLKLLGINGLGIIPLPEFAATELLAEKKLYKIGTLTSVMEEYWLISAARKIENPVAAKLMKNFKLRD